MNTQVESGRATSRGLPRAWGGLVGAITFLTIVPVHAGTSRQARFEFNDSLAWFPLVGAVIGAFAGGLRVVCQPLVGRGTSTAVAMVGLVVITGALHQDGLADAADGLGVRGDRTRRLAVMRDSATGAFGVLALIGWALLLFSTLESLTATQALRALIVAGAAGRLAALLHVAGAPPARQDGLGAGVRITPTRVAIGALSSLLVSVAATGIARGLVGVGACALMSGLSALLARRAIGGSTGDTIGATVAVTEVAVCVALLATWH